MTMTKIKTKTKTNKRSVTKKGATKAIPRTSRHKPIKKIRLMPLKQEAPSEAMAAAKRIRGAVNVLPKEESDGRVLAKKTWLTLDALLGWTPDGQLIFRWRNPKGGTTTKFINSASVAAAFSRTPILSPWFEPGLVRWGRTPQGDVQVYYFPPSVRTYAAIVSEVYVGARGLHQTEDRIEFEVPMPAFLWAAIGDEYRLFAMQGTEFGEQGDLFMAPLPNVYDNGTICWGVNEKPRPGKVDPQQAWSLFWEAPFTGSAIQNKSRVHADDVRRQLVTLAGEPIYPTNDLVRARVTLASLFDVSDRRQAWED